MYSFTCEPWKPLTKSSLRGGAGDGGEVGEGRVEGELGKEWAGREQGARLLRGGAALVKQAA